MLCVTGVCLRDTTNTFFFNFALEYELSEWLLLLLQLDVYLRKFLLFSRSCQHSQSVSVCLPGSFLKLSALSICLCLPACLFPEAVSTVSLSLSACLSLSWSCQHSWSVSVCLPVSFSKLSAQSVCLCLPACLFTEAVSTVGLSLSTCLSLSWSCQHSWSVSVCLPVSFLAHSVFSQVLSILSQRAWLHTRHFPEYWFQGVSWLPGPASGQTGNARRKSSVSQR